MRTEHILKKSKKRIVYVVRRYKTLSGCVARWSSLILRTKRHWLWTSYLLADRIFELILWIVWASACTNHVTLVVDDDDDEDDADSCTQCHHHLIIYIIIQVKGRKHVHKKASENYSSASDFKT